MLRSLFEGTKTKFTWCRLFYLWGEGEREGRLIYELNKALMENRKFVVENGNLVRDYLHITEAANQIVNVINSNKFDSVNICSGKGISLSNLVLKIAESTGKINLIEIKEIRKLKSISFPIIGDIDDN
jgi:nucleoside-diphosphate-sugar epimerase